jgi:hypothetical protein
MTPIPTPMPTVQMIDEPGAAERYRAGACNIGPDEIRRRRRTGIAAAIATVVIAVILVAINAPAWARLLIFFPAAGAAVGLLQARFRFCVAFAMQGIRNFGPVGGVDKVADAADHRADLVAAAKLIALSLLAGAVVAVVFALLPV